MATKVKEKTNEDEAAARARIARIIGHKTRHTIPQNEIDKAVQSLDVSQYMRIMILPNEEWAANRLNILHLDRKDNNGVVHNRAFHIARNLSENEVSLGDRDEGINCVFDPGKPFITLLEDVCHVKKPEEMPYDFTERILLVYAPDVDNPNAARQ